MKIYLGQSGYNGFFNYNGYNGFLLFLPFLFDMFEDEKNLDAIIITCVVFGSLMGTKGDHRAVSKVYI